MAWVKPIGINLKNLMEENERLKTDVKRLEDQYATDTLYFHNKWMECEEKLKQSRAVSDCDHKNSEGLCRLSNYIEYCVEAPCPNDTTMNRRAVPEDVQRAIDLLKSFMRSAELVPTRKHGRFMIPLRSVKVLLSALTQMQKPTEPVQEYISMPDSNGNMQRYPLPPCGRKLKGGGE